MRRRTAASHAAFFTPHLVAGMRVLDCGCGPGSITCGLAALVPPGYVVGIDRDPTQVEAARAYAKGEAVVNVHFQIGDAYEMPFPDGYFDAVFSHALLDHLSDPLKAVQEMRRVTRGGGVIGLCAPDFDGHITAPPGSAMADVLRLWKQLTEANGASPHVGSRLRGLLHAAGCVRVVASARYECHGTEAELERLGRSVAESLGPEGLFVRAGAADVDQLAAMAVELLEWARRPDAFLARPWCEAVGWVP